MRYVIQPKDEGLKIRDILKRRLDLSTRLIRKLKEEGGVSLDGKERWLNEPVRKGQVLEVRFPEETSWFEPQEIPLDIRLEDEDLLILNKQPGIVVHPTKGHPAGTIANGLACYMRQKGESWKIRFVNRLDMDTSGLLIVSKNAFSQERLQKQMKAGTVVKKYRAVVDGILEEEEGVIDLPIGLIGENEVGRCVRPDGYPSVTKYKKILEIGTERTLAELTLETGRTHQIRVHMAHIGHPVTGDSLYGKPQPELIGRQALHAWSLSFDHPTTNKRIEITAEIPEDMEKLCVKK
ncbi:MAG: RluA family pseudouridine synthase [Firmicutes bacterium]|nr:RluA family pseudouridine synthase [Bacillota bacterium]MBR6504037.1 RluA family pseudouridine synthase [Bacillota bacterium]